MKYVSGHLWLFCLCVGLLAMSGIARAGEVSLKAVAINDSPITPTSSVTAGPGDVIECEIFLSEWSPTGANDEKLKSWQVTVDGLLFGTPAVPVLPIYWDYVDSTRLCYTPADCNAGEICWIQEGAVQGFCAGPNHHPEDGNYIDSLRSDYVFAPAGSPPPEFKGVDMSGMTFRYASTLLQVLLAPLYSPPPKYSGTFTFKLMPGACGLFNVELAEPPETFFVRLDNQVLPPNVTGLEVDAGECVCKEIGAVDPPNCAIDARQPSRPDGTQPDGWDSMTITFVDDPPCDPCDLVIEDFSIRELPFDPMGRPPTIVDISCSHDPETVTLTFNRIINESLWTCVRYIAANEEFCIGHQPGDVNVDRTSAPSDILYVIDCLNNVYECELNQCDVDRSGVCGPPDILRVIDLLNGAGNYPSYLNTQIPACPTAR